MTDELSKLKFYDKEDRPWPTLRLTSSAIVGHVTSRTARIWVRVHTPGDYCLVVSESEINCECKPSFDENDRVNMASKNSDSHFLRAQTYKAHINYSTDNTKVFDVQKLSASTRYFYALFSLDDQRTESWEVGRDEVLAFQTPPNRLKSVTFGLYSCHMPFKGRNIVNMNMWESFLELLQDTKAGFVIGAGDQVYTDGDKNVNIWSWLKKHKDEISRLTNTQQQSVMLSWYRDIYRGYWGDLSLRSVFRSFPNYMIWDDHELMDGWGSYTPKELSNQLDTIWEWENQKENLMLAQNMFVAASQAYYEYQHSHNPKTLQDQWDYEFKWSHLAFFVFDMRGHRAYDEDPNKSTILGEHQWDRFIEWLHSPSTLNAPALFIVSPVPVVHLCSFIVNTLDLPALGLADDLRDEWEHESNSVERNRLLDEVFDFSQKNNKPVVFLSGDVHIGAAFKLSRKGEQIKAKVFQLTSSGITYAKAPGWLLKLVVKKRGVIHGIHDSDETFVDAPETDKTFFENLHVFEDNNFGLIHVRNEPRKPVEISWDLYGNTGEEDQLVRLKRVRLF